MKIVRHRDDRCNLNVLFENGRMDLFEEGYQAFQGRDVFKCDFIVSCIGLPNSTAKFLGVYKVRGKRSAREVLPPPDFPFMDLFFPGGRHGPGFWYDLEKVKGFEDLENRAEIAWGQGTIQWGQWLTLEKDKEVLRFLKQPILPNGLPPVPARLSRDGATDVAADHSPEFILKDGDERALILRQIHDRQGQPAFRNDLRKRYGDRCLVTGCKILAVLEAAHIKPYLGEKDNHPENGLLLRADIHTLFDLDLLGIEPQLLRVELHPSLADSAAYKNFVGKTLRCTEKQRPSKDALKLRYALFQERLG